MKTYRKLVAVMMLSGICLAAAAPDAGGVAGAKRSKKKHPAEVQATEEKRCEACEAIEQLKEQIRAQQAEIDQLKAAQSAQQTPPPPPPPTADEQARAAAAEAKRAADQAAAAAAEANANANAAKSDVAGIKQSNETTLSAVTDTQKRVTDLEAPNYLHYKNIRITPGGFLAADMVWRQRALNADTYSNFNQIPYATDDRYHMTEFRGSARPSRITLLAEGTANSTKLAGYFELDFEGAAPNANENQSSSFNPRMRQAFGQASWHGWTVTGGQQWTLLTLNRSGIKNLGEFIPSTVDGNYLPGYTMARLFGLRVAKSFDEGKATAAFSLEQPAELVAGNVSSAFVTGGPGTVNLANGGGTCTATSTSTSTSTGGVTTTTTTATTCTVVGGVFSTNIAPDLMAKVAFDPKFGHIEVKAVGRFFRDRIPGAGGTNNVTPDGGFGAGVVIPVLHKKVSLIAEGMAGRGIARYGIGGNQAGADMTIFSNGSIHPLDEVHGMGAIEAQITPKLMWYVYGGEDYISRDFEAGTTTGYGSPNLVISAGCFGTDTGATNSKPAPTCNAATKSLIQGTTGFWYNFYKGGYGTLRYGMQYSWTFKNTWHGTTNGPDTSDSMVFSSLRYVLP